MDQINHIHKIIERERLRKIECYYDMRRRIIRTAIENGEIYDDVLRLFTDFENNDNSYSEQRLREMWLRVVGTLNKPIYGDKNGSLILKLVITKNEISDFRNRFRRFEELIVQMDYLYKSLQDFVSTMDISRCKEDAVSYACEMIDEVNDILLNCNCDSSLKHDIHENLLLEISSSNKRDVLGREDILSKIRSSKASVALDDYARLVTLVQIITKLGQLIAGWL